MISIIQNNDLYEIRFRYNPDVVYIIKQVPGRKWDPDKKLWTIPKDKLGWFVKYIRGTQYERYVKIESLEQLDVNDTVDATATIPDIDLSAIPFYVKAGSKPYAHQLDFMKFAIDRQQRGYKSGFIVCDEQGLGKAVSLDTKVYTPTGYKLMKDIDVGDVVFDMNGNRVEVLRTYYHDNLNMFRITFCDNRSIVCCEDHLWLILNSDKQEFVCNTSQLIDGSFRYQKARSGYSYCNYNVPRCCPIPFDEQEVVIDPWLLGFILGDGSFTQDSVSITTSHNDLVEAVLNHLPDLHTLHKHSYDKISYTIVNSLNSTLDESRNTYIRTHTYPNIVVSEFKRLNLLGCNAKFKFIPDVYKYNSEDVRRSILQGLMDSDGYAMNPRSNTHIFTTTSASLAEDVRWVCESLGYLTSMRSYTSKYNDKITGVAYDVTIRCDDPRELYRYSEKRIRANSRKYKPRRTFKSIEYVGTMPGKCITVSGDTHTYVCDHFIVTHNTVEAMNLAIYNRKQYGFKHCLIICCVNSSKYNWKRDIEEHTNFNEHPYILGTRKKKRGGEKIGSSKDKLEDLVTRKQYGDTDGDDLPYFIITNIESIRYGQKKVYPIVNEIISMINNGEIGMIVVDEIHKNASPGSIQGQKLSYIKKRTNELVEWLPMTGTPITNKPTDVYLPLQLIGGHSFTSFYMWCREFCVYGGYNEIIGYKNIPRLKAMLQNNMIRRMKADVLDLPPKIHYTEYVENTTYQEKLYNETLSSIKKRRNEIVQSMNPLASLLKLRQVNGSPELVDVNLPIDPQYPKHNAKFLRIFELLEEIHSRGEKVVIFSNWVEPLRTLYKFIAKRYKVCYFTGTMNADDRERNKLLFQNDPSHTVLIGTIGAAGTTHTFTAASNIIFLDEPWTPSDKVQAEDRCHRIGTNQPVNIYTLITKDTVDEKVHDILYTKSNISSYIVDNKIDLVNNPKLFDFLLGDTRSK